MLQCALRMFSTATFDSKSDEKQSTVKHQTSETHFQRNLGENEEQYAMQS